MAATTSRTYGDHHELPDEYQSKKDKDQGSPKSNKLWIQTTPNNNPNPNPSTASKVPVIYFLSRNGHLDQPHFMEVPPSSISGLCLSDFTNRLDLLRGKGFASFYSWSFKRSYKSGFVWHDLAGNELIHPSHGNEYILKGSELPDSTPRLPAASSFPSPKPPSKSQACSTIRDDSDSSAELQLPPPMNNDSASQRNSHEYKVLYKSKTEPDDGESPGKPCSNASTQTDDRRTRRSKIVEDQAEIEECQTTEQTREDITPPPSDSSPETLGTLILANRRRMQHSDYETKTNRTGVNLPRGKERATSFLMHLVSCGSLSFKAGGLTSEGFSLVAPHKGSMVRRAGNYKPGTSREI